jgi:hypothetical protein
MVSNQRGCGMKNPTLFKNNLTDEQACEIMNYLFCEHIYYVGKTSDNKIMWFNRKDEMIAKWTDEYKNLMISKDFLDFVHKGIDI